MGRPSKQLILRRLADRVLALKSLAGAKADIEAVLWCLRGDVVVYNGIWNAYTYLYYEYQGPTWMDSVQRAEEYIKDILHALRGELQRNSEVEPDGDHTT